MLRIVKNAETLRGMGVFKGEYGDLISSNALMGKLDIFKSDYRLQRVFLILNAPILECLF